MADKTVIVEIQYDTAAAVKSLETLTSTIEGEKVAQQQLKSELEKGKVSQNKYSQEVAKSRATGQKANKERNATIKLLQSEKGSINELRAQNTRLNQQRNKINTTTKEGQKRLKGLNKQLDVNNAAMKRNLDVDGKRIKSIGNYKEGLAGMTGGVSDATSGIMGMTKAVIMFIATPLGAIIGAIVLALSALSAAFTGSEEGQNKWNKIVTVSGAIIGNFVDLLADLGEIIIAAFENPQEAVKAFAKLVKQNIINRFEGLMELIPALGKAVSLLFEGEFAEAGKVAGNAVAKVTLGVDDLGGKIDKATEKTKEFVAEQIKEGTAAAGVADMRAKADKIERKLLVERSKLESRIAVLRLKAKKEDEFSAADRKKALKEAQSLEDSLISKEVEYLQLRSEAQTLENTFSRSNKENLDKEATAQAQVNNKIAERSDKARTLQRELNTLNNEIEADANKEQALIDKIDAAKEKAAKKEAERRGKAINKLAELKNAELVLEAKTIDDKKAAQEKAENDKYTLAISDKALLDSEIEVLEAEHKARMLEIEVAHDEQKRAMRQAALNEAREGMQEIIAATQGFSDQRVSILSDTFSKISTLDIDEETSSKDKFIAIGEAAQGLTSLITAGHQQQLADFNAQKSAELALTGDDIKAKEKIEKKYNKKLVELKKQQFKEEKTKAIIDASIATALAVAKSLPNIPLAIFSGVLGAASIAIIASKKAPNFSSDKVFEEGGGIVDGASHDNGGVDITGSNGQYFGNVQGDEAMYVLKKEATAEINALSQLNQSHGGRSFNEGTNGHYADGGQISPVDISESINTALENANIIVKVADISTGLTDMNQVKDVGVI